MIVFLTLLAFFGTTFYGVMLFYGQKSWKKITQLSALENGRELPFISVIIAARNEEQHLAKCLTAVFQQNYPRHLFEIILINDHSEDQTPAIANQFIDQGLRLFHLADYLENKKIKAYKKAALQLGIEQSKGAYIVLTDADCTMSSKWLLQFGQAFQSGKNIILGPVRLVAPNNFLGAFQGLDVAGTMILTGASLQNGNPLLANGANFGFSRQLFHALDGYEGNKNQASGDDVFLLQKAKKNKSSRFFFLSSPAGIVDTPAVETWPAFFQQRLRWAAKTSGYTDWQLLVFQSGVFGLNVLLLFLHCWAFCQSSGLMALAATVIWLLKMIFEYYYLSFATKTFQRSNWMRYFLASQLIHPFYIIVIGTLALLPVQISWKNRRG